MKVMEAMKAMEALRSKVNVISRLWMLKRSKKYINQLLINLNKFRNTSEVRSILEWAALDRKLHKVLNSMKKNYPKGSHPPTLDPVFLADAAKLANRFLVTPNTDQGYIEFSRRLTICKENNDVNEDLLIYATSIAIFKRYVHLNTSKLHNTICLFLVQN